MPCFLLVLEYDGTCFHGSQRQQGARTVQGELERTLEELMQEPVRAVFAGRTDAGVHAVAQVASFRTGREWQPEILERALNALLPRDVSVRATFTVPERFNARRAARRRRYSYWVLNRPQRSALLDRYVWHWPWQLDLGAMRESLAALKGRHWFGAYGRAPSGGHCWRTLWRADLYQQCHLLNFVFEADAFLRRMVRLLVGAVLDVGRGRLKPAALVEALQEGAGPVSCRAAPAKGLRLEAVAYERESLGFGGSGLWWSNQAPGGTEGTLDGRFTVENLYT
jgi:tRNA pseudouridine38-40 synthase